MCFSAQVEESYKKLERNYGGHPNWPEIERLFWKRVNDDKPVRIAKGLELAFEHPSTPQEERIKALIVEYRTKTTRELEQELFKQKKRLGDAERTLKTKTTKKALEDQRIATDKIDSIVKRIASVNRTEPKPGDDRIFPFWWTLITVEEGGQRKIIPARYHCRPAGKPEFLDRKFDGLYNARRDSLEKFWRELYGTNHAVMQVSAFYENVSLHNYEKRDLQPEEKEQNVVLYFNPKPAIDMHIACLWSRWSDDLVSFAAITDEPPAEVAAAGHDRMIIAMRLQNVDAWLKPDGKSIAELYSILDDKERPYYEHLRIAA
jgi:putative SOS response-associated peptidase YedK